MVVYGVNGSNKKKSTVLLSTDECLFLDMKSFLLVDHKHAYYNRCPTKSAVIFQYIPSGDDPKRERNLPWSTSKSVGLLKRSY